MKFEVHIDDISREQWEQNAKQFADYSVYQTWPYQQIRAKADRQRLSRAMVIDQTGKPVTMCHVRIKDVKPLGLKIGYVQWGPLFRDKENKITCSADALRELYRAYMGRTVNIFRIVPNAPDNETGRIFTQMLQQAGFAHIDIVRPYRTFMLPLEGSEEDVRSRLHKSFRRDLKSVEKSKIEIKEGTNKEYHDILRKLYQSLLDRKQFNGLNPKEFAETQGMLAESEKMNVVAAYMNGEPVAAHLSSNLGDTAVVLLAASNEKGLACYASYLIWWKAALAARTAGMKIYDLGGIDPVNNPSVYQFKSRMGGNDCQYIGAFEACNSSSTRIMWRIAEKTYNYIRGK